MLIVGAALFLGALSINVHPYYQLIVGAAPFINSASW